jgi:hypothetical protein
MKVLRCGMTSVAFLPHISRSPAQFRPLDVSTDASPSHSRERAGLNVADEFLVGSPENPSKQEFKAQSSFSQSRKGFTACQNRATDFWVTRRA